MILEKLQEVFRDIFDDEEFVIYETTTRQDIEEWDSLANINIIIAIEQEFNIKINLEELEQLTDIGSMIKIIEKKKG